MRLMLERIGARSWAIPVALFSAALGLGLLQIGSKSLWYDESVSISYATSSFAQMWHQIAGHDSNGSLYYVLLWIWVHLAGQGEGIVRLPSAVFAATTAPILYLLARRLFTTRVAVVAAILLICQGLFIAYAQEARSYALAMLLATLSSYFVVRARQDGGGSSWILYVVSIAAGMYAHLFIVLVAAGHAIWLIAERVRARTFIATYLLVALLSSPMLAFAILNPGPDWMHGLQFDALGWTLLAFVSGTWITLVSYAALVLVAIWLAVGRHQNRVTFVVLWLSVPVVTMIAGSALHPLLVARYLIVALPALALALAVGATALWRWPTRVAVTVILALSIVGLGSWYLGEPKHDWRAATGYVADRALPSDAVIFYPAHVSLPFEYYLTRLSLSAPVDVAPATASSVWLVMQYEWTGVTPPALAALRDLLEETHKPRGPVVHFHGVGVWLFVPKG